MCRPYVSIELDGPDCCAGSPALYNLIETAKAAGIELLRPASSSSALQGFVGHMLHPCPHVPLQVRQRDWATGQELLMEGMD